MKQLHKEYHNQLKDGENCTVYQVGNIAFEVSSAYNDDSEKNIHQILLAMMMRDDNALSK